MKLGWFKMLMAVALISSLTRPSEVRGIRFVRLRSKLKYLGPLRLFTGKLPKVPGAGADIKPAFSFEVATLPSLRVMSRIAGFTNMRPAGVLKSPMLFLKSAKVMPTSWAPIPPVLELKVARPDVTYQGAPLAQV